MSSGHAAENLSARVAFSDVQRVLTLFVQGLAGRALRLQSIETFVSHSSPNRIATDAASICLPPEVATFAHRHHNLGVYRIATLRQIGRMEDGAATFDLTAAMMQMPARSVCVLRRAAAFRESLQPLAKPISDLELFLSAWRRPILLRRVFGTLEAFRIDTIIRHRYPGAQRDLDRVLKHALSRRPPLHTLRPLSVLIEGLVRLSLGAQRTESESREDICPHARLLVAAMKVQAETASVYDSAQVALDICAGIEDSVCLRSRRDTATQVVDPLPMAGAVGSEQTNDAVAVHDIAEPQDGDGAGGEPSATLTPDFADWVRHAGQSGSPKPALPSSAQMPAPAGNDGADGHDTSRQQARPSSFLAPRVGPGEPRSFFYDEWDYVRRGYLKAWCRVWEQRLRGDDFGFLAEVRRHHALVAHQIRQHGGFVKPESRQRVRRTSDGDELDLDSMIETVIDRRTGHATDAHLYTRRDRRRRDVCAAFLVDMSASTDFPIPQPIASPVVVTRAEAVESDRYLYGGEDVSPAARPPPKRRVIDVAKEALALMCDAVGAFGDSQAIYGFSGDGRDRVEFYVAKDFSDAWSARTGAALAAMQPRRSTRTGPAIRHAITKLANQPEIMKVLIIVSDGYPEDRDYGPDSRDIDYGIQDTACALQEAERAGIVAFCIAIDPAGHDYLRKMCSENSYLVIDDVADLPSQLAKIYRALTVRQ